LASKQGTSNGPDWKDVTRAALEYMRDWNGVVTVSLRPYGTDKQPGMTVVAQLWADQKSVGAVAPLASASVSLSAYGASGTSAAALASLYELDKEVYRREMGVSPIRR